MRVERRGRVVRVGSAANQRGEEPVSEPKPKVKPFAISKRVVWEAYQRVKANHGAAGRGRPVDRGVRERPEREPLQALESAVLGELLPAAGAAGGDTERARAGVRVLGVPTVATAWPRRSSSCIWSRWWSRSSIPTPTAIDREIGAGCGGRVPRAVLEKRLGDRS